MISFIAALVSYLLGVIDKLGYIGIFIGMTIESSFIPLPSELILIPVGALIAQGKMQFSTVFLLALCGSLFGALINYSLSLLLGRRVIEHFVSKHGKAFLISKEELDKTDAYFKSHGEVTTFIGRLMPGVRHLISIPAGFSRINLYKFSLFTALGWLLEPGSDICWMARRQKPSMDCTAPYTYNNLHSTNICINSFWVCTLSLKKKNKRVKQ